MTKKKEKDISKRDISEQTKEENKPGIFLRAPESGIDHHYLETYLKCKIKEYVDPSSKVFANITNDIGANINKISKKYKTKLNKIVKDIETTKKTLQKFNIDLANFKQYRDLVNMSNPVEYNQFENIVVNNSFYFDSIGENVDDLNKRLLLVSGTAWEDAACAHEEALESAKQEQVDKSFSDRFFNNERAQLKQEIVFKEAEYEKLRETVLAIQYVKRKIRVSRLKHSAEQRKDAEKANYDLSTKMLEIASSCESFTTLNQKINSEIQLLMSNMSTEMTNISNMFKSTKYGTGDEDFENVVNLYVNGILLDNKNDNQTDLGNSYYSSERIEAKLKDHKSSIVLPGEITMTNMLNDAGLIAQTSEASNTASANNEKHIRDSVTTVDKLKKMEQDLIEAKLKLENIKAEEAKRNP